MSDLGVALVSSGAALGGVALTLVGQALLARGQRRHQSRVALFAERRAAYEKFYWIVDDALVAGRTAAEQRADRDLIIENVNKAVAALGLAFVAIQVLGSKAVRNAAVDVWYAMRESPDHLINERFVDLIDRYLKAVRAELGVED